jgi:transposase
MHRNVSPVFDKAETRFVNCGLGHQKEKRRVKVFAGLSVSSQRHQRVHCGWRHKIVGESGPEVLGGAEERCLKQIGLEARPLSQWLFGMLVEVRLPVICVDTCHMRAVLRAQTNKADRSDGRSIAQMMRVGSSAPQLAHIVVAVNLLSWRASSRSTLSQRTCYLGVLSSMLIAK